MPNYFGKDNILTLGGTRISSEITIWRDTDLHNLCWNDDKGIVDEDDRILEGETTSSNNLVVASHMNFQNAKGMSEVWISLYYIEVLG